MRGAIAIAMREIHDRRLVLAAALLAGFVPFAMPLVPGVRPDDAGTAIDAAAVMLSLGLGALLAVSLGATVVGRDLAARRLGFDLARPVGELAIWGGRLGSAAVLAAAAMVLVVGPALVAGLVGVGFRLPDDAPALATVGVAGASLLLLVPLAHVAGVVARSRSRWLAFDAVAAAVVGLVAVLAVRRLTDVYAYRSAVELAAVGVAAAIPALWLASAVQVTRGRSDLVAGHRAQSLALWPALLAIALGMTAYGMWFVAVDPQELTDIDPRGASSGGWLTVTGVPEGRDDYRAGFLLDSDSGRTIALGAFGRMNGEIMISADGTRAVWLDRGDLSTPVITVRAVDLDDPRARPVETRVRFSALLSPVRAAAVSPTGRRLAGVQHDTLAVHDVDDGRLLASVKLPATDDGWYLAMHFRGEDVVRVFRVVDGSVLAMELDVGAKRLRTLAGGEGDARPLRGNWVHRTRDDRLVLLIEGWGRGATVLDGADLTPSWRLPDVPDGVKRSVDFLADGRVVSVVVADGASPAVTIYTDAGEPVRRLTIDAPADVPALGHEIRPGVFLVGLAARDEAGTRWVERRLYVVDAATGAVDRVPDTTALPFRWWWSAGWAPPEPGSARSRLLAGDSCDVVLIDPGDLSTRRILGGTCPPPPPSDDDEG